MRLSQTGRATIGRLSDRSDDNEDDGFDGRDASGDGEAVTENIHEGEEEDGDNEDQSAWVRKLRKFFLRVCLGRDAKRQQQELAEGGGGTDDDDPTGATEDVAGGARGRAWQMMPATSSNAFSTLVA